MLLFEFHIYDVHVCVCVCVFHVHKRLIVLSLFITQNI